MEGGVRFMENLKQDESFKSFRISGLLWDIWGSHGGEDIDIDLIDFSVDVYVHVHMTLVHTRPASTLFGLQWLVFVILIVSYTKLNCI
jgi:hypothetical protein